MGRCVHEADEKWGGESKGADEKWGGESVTRDVVQHCKLWARYPVSCKNVSGREKISASRDFTVCIIRCVYRAELILGR